MKDSATRSVQPPPFVLTTQSNSVDVDWFGTVRGKLGYAVGNWLIYGTGGLAYGRVDASGTFVNVSNPRTWTGSVNTTRTGWTAGGGANYGLTPHCIVGIEYLFVDLGHMSYIENSVVTVPPQQFVVTNRAAANIVRASFDYKF
jgi:outer membrane immunogenic protein